MTRKDYELIAACFADQMREANIHDMYAEHAQAYLNALARDLAHEFANDNPRFDRNKFMEACGL